MRPPIEDIRARAIMRREAFGGAPIPGDQTEALCDYATSLERAITQALVQLAMDDAAEFPNHQRCLRMVEETLRAALNVPEGP